MFKPLQVIALCHDTLKTPPHQFCIRFCIYAETICNIAYLNQKAKWQTVQMGSTPVAAKIITQGFGCRIKFYAENTTCRLFRRELWCAKAPLLETFMRRLFLHNNLTREKSEFQPANADLVTVYVCGPTVYGPAHIGNARPAVVFDVLVRLLRELYPAVSYARNITDIDDKINAAAEKASISRLLPTDIAQNIMKIWPRWGLRHPILSRMRPSILTILSP